jgi:hypothetical protein
MNVHVIKTVPITFKMVVDAYQKVKRGGKAAGIDGESWGHSIRMHKAIFMLSGIVFHQEAIAHRR